MHPVVILFDRAHDAVGCDMKVCLVVFIYIRCVEKLFVTVKACNMPLYQKVTDVESRRQGDKWKSQTATLHNFVNACVRLSSNEIHSGCKFIKIFGIDTIIVKKLWFCKNNKSISYGYGIIQPGDFNEAGGSVVAYCRRNGGVLNPAKSSTIRSAGTP